ncbi:MAG: sigma-70 family RNA polymerase sigma factor [Saprospiraceae bacterium]
MNNPPSFTDPEFLQRLLASPESRKQAMYEMFQSPDLRRMAFHYLLRHGAEDYDAEDVFQEAVLLFERALRKGAFRAQAGVSTYFMGIIKKHWFNLQRKRRPEVAIDPSLLSVAEAGPDVFTLLITAERKEILWKAIALMGGRCAELLKVWSLSVPPPQIAVQFQLRDADAAKKETNRCRTKFKNFLDKHPHWRDTLQN